MKFNSTILGVVFVCGMIFWLLERRFSRSWFQFSLRTILTVVTVLSVCLAWLGWELKYVRDRQKWISTNQPLIRPLEPVLAGWSKQGELAHDTNKSAVDVFYSHARTKGVPFWRIWLGDKPVPSIVFPLDWTDHEHVKTLFPEAMLGQEAPIEKKVIATHEPPGIK
jgi:hypothetical protein